MFKLMRKTLVISLAVFFIMAISFFAFMRGKYILPVLMYHSVCPQDDPGANALVVTPQTFEKQMRFLKQFGYNIMPLKAAAESLERGKKPAGNAVVLTFDDGYKDNYTYVFPVLKKYRLPATMFIIINEVGRPDRLSWDQIKEMQASGLVSFGSHCLGPEPLVNIQSGEELKKQVFDSKRILEEKLGSPVAMFSYPEGRFNDKIKQLVKDAGYKLAVATSPGKAYSSSDIFLIKRLRISENASNPVVFWFKTTGIYGYFRENRPKYNNVSAE